MHELSRNIFREANLLADKDMKLKFDAIVTKYLQEKAKELSKIHSEEYSYSLLGLSPSSEEDLIRPYCNHCEIRHMKSDPCCFKKSPSSGVGECDHTLSNCECKMSLDHKPKDLEGLWLCPKCNDVFISKWAYCPIDGTPRPTPKTLAEKLYEAWTKNQNGACYGWEDVDHKAWERVADIAQQHFNQESK